MQINRMLLWGTYFIYAVCFLSCINKTEGNLLTLDVPELKAPVLVNKKTILLKSQWNYLRNNKSPSDDFILKYNERSTANLIKKLEDTNLFNVRTEGGNYDYFVYVVHSVTHRENWGMNYIAANTLLFPAVYNTYYSVILQIKDRNGIQVFRSFRSAEQTFEIGLILIFAMPFDWFLADKHNVYGKFIKFILSELYKQVEVDEKGERREAPYYENTVFAEMQN